MSRWILHKAKRYQRELSGSSYNEPHTPGSRGRMHHHHVSCGWLFQRVVGAPLHNHKREWKKVWRKIAHNFFFQLLFIVVSTLGGFICSFSPGFMWWCVYVTKYSNPRKCKSVRVGISFITVCAMHDCVL